MKPRSIRIPDSDVKRVDKLAPRIARARAADPLHDGGDEPPPRSEVIRIALSTGLDKLEAELDE